MSQKSLPLTDMINMAEGSPEPNETREPDTRLYTSTMPAVRSTARTPSSETGLNDVVHTQAEGHEDHNRQDAGAPDDAEPVEATVATTDGDDKPILIVEDTLELAEVIQGTLENMGLKSVHESHGKAGLERMKELQPRVMLVDIGLPDITGWKMLDQIKEYATTHGSAMPTIIVITAYGDPANRLVGKLQGIHSYLIKPFLPDEVERVVRAALRGEPIDDAPPPAGGDESAEGDAPN